MQNINDLRKILFDTMQDLKAGKIDTEKAKAITDIGQVLVNSAKVEVDFIRQAGGVGSGFVPFNVAGEKKSIERPPAVYSNNGHAKALEKYS